MKLLTTGLCLIPAALAASQTGAQKMVLKKDDNTIGSYEWFSSEVEMTMPPLNEMHSTCMIDTSDIDFDNLQDGRHFKCEIFYQKDGNGISGDACEIKWKKSNIRDLNMNCFKVKGRGFDEGLGFEKNYDVSSYSDGFLGNTLKSGFVKIGEDGKLEEIDGSNPVPHEAGDKYQIKIVWQRKFDMEDDNNVVLKPGTNVSTKFIIDYEGQNYKMYETILVDDPRNPKIVETLSFMQLLTHPEYGTYVIIAIAAILVVLLICIACCCCCLFSRRQKNRRGKTINPSASDLEMGDAQNTDGAKTPIGAMVVPKTADSFVVAEDRFDRSIKIQTKKEYDAKMQEKYNEAYADPFKAQAERNKPDTK